MIELTEPTSVDLHRPVAPQIYQTIRQRIIRNEMPPGCRISEAELAQSFSVSRQPVREAFIMLANDGLVTVLPHRGTYVTKISIDAVMDARFVREAIEAEIVQLLAQDHDAALNRELNDQVSHQKRAVETGDPAQFSRLDELFHQTLAQACNKLGAWDVIHRQKAQMDRVRYLSLVELQTLQLLEQHEAIVSAIAARDIAAAGLAMRTHLRKILDDLPAIVKIKPELFEPRR